MKSVRLVIVILVFVIFFFTNCGKSVDLVMFTVGQEKVYSIGTEELVPISERVDLSDNLVKKKYGLKIKTDDILFKYNSTEIASAKNAVKQVIEFTKILKKHKDIKYKIIVTGHSDKKGTKAFNKKLSVDRAIKIYDILVNVYDVLNKERGRNVTFDYSGRGNKDPLLGNLQLSRRVEFLFILVSDPRGKLIIP